MKKTTRLLSLLLSALLMVGPLAACGGGATPSGSTPGTPGGAEKDTFTVALDSDIVKLDPAFAYDYTTNPVINQITQGLLVFDDNMQVQPLLAKSWEQVDDLTYVYQIRDDVTFSDGSAMTMDDVIFSLERTRDPALASYMSWMFDSVDTMEQTGDWELTVKLKVPDATWQYSLATTAGHVISKSFAEAAGDKLGTPEGGLMGTGPYKFVSWQNGTEVVLVRNENYWGADPGYFENLVFKIISEDTTRVTAMTTGDVDCTMDPPSDMLSVLKDSPNVTLADSEGFGITYVAFNTEKAPFDNENVRKAIYHAINFQSIQENLIQDAGSPGTALPSSAALFSLEPERWADYAAGVPTYEYDVELAKSLLSEAGYADGFDCTMCTSESSLRGAIALAMQNDLAAVGINVTLNKVSGDEHTAYQFGEILDADGKRDYDMIMAGWEADYPDPAGNLITKQAQSSDSGERNTLMFEAFDIITDEVPYIFVYYPTKYLALNSAYTGVTMNAAWSWNLHLQNARPVA